ncbi:FAD-dependent oxidoreductase [Noviherbaspirillum sp. Root189]|uniref:FAD-dependent oxidoreductase n=1 Tax=Noviherbaspirillum sp. Root189 TaxID=1736487 RepID=UPI00070DB4C1|nr:FAD-dependent oxidoreductase [Noviherbaspirillum sp. Root189]KRB93532.1 hypothetical protein ASE07_12580 [Noviherbaspirillum sp. Root189]
MNSSVRRVLIIGGGFSGMSAAIQFRKLGIEVDMVEIDPGWRAYGAGISLGGATLRAFRTLGILDEFLKRGAATDGLDIRLATGQVIGSVPTPRIAGPDVPGGGGIMRPELAAILAEATRAAGVSVRLGCSFAAIEQDEEGVNVRFTDGRRKRFDLVVGADGLYSKVRTTLFPDAPQPRYFGQGVWRAVLRRPAEVQRPTMWIGEHIKPGFNPVSADAMYMFITENRPQNAYVDPAEFVGKVKDLLAPFPDPLLQSLRAQLSDDSLINYRPLEGLLMKGAWYDGRIVLIGDAVHATTPHLASGACIGIEDGIVLAEEIGNGGTAAQALARFQARRFERCRMVVENSARLGEIEIQHGDKEEHASIMRQSMMALATPI